MELPIPSSSSSANQHNAQGFIILDPQTGLPVPLATGIQFRQDLYSWTGSQAVADTAFFPFDFSTFTAANDNDIKTVPSAGAALKFPVLDPKSSVIFRVRISGTVAGGAGTAREWKYQLRRPVTNVVVGSSSTVKVSGVDISNRDVSMISWTDTVTDPFGVDGIILGMQNDSGQIITLTSIQVTIQRIMNAQ